MPDTDFCGELKIRLACREPMILNEADYHVSSVVVPLVKLDEGLGVVFEVRSSQLSRQPGEVCFPGGRIEQSDASPQEAGAREMCEELGLSPDNVEILGQLDYIISPIGVFVYPFVGFIRDSSLIRHNCSEVAEVFTVPLRFLLHTEPLIARTEVATRPMAGTPFELLPPGYAKDWSRRTTYPVYFYQYQGYVIWGLTARILKNFLSLCRGLK